MVRLLCIAHLSLFAACLTYPVLVAAGSVRDTLLSSVRKTGKCLVAYEDNRFGGYGAEIAAIVAEEAFDYLDGPVSRIAGPDVPGVPYNHALEDWFMLSPAKIADAIRKLAAY